MQIEVVRSFLQAGIPVAKADQVRTLLEDRNPCLTDTSHLPQHIPFNLEQETELLREEVAAADYCVVIFDGSTCQREALTSLRYVDEDWCFQPAADSISCSFKEHVRSATCL